MSKANISKFWPIVILLISAAAIVSGCSRAVSRDQKLAANAVASSDYEKPKVIGEIRSNAVTESSGIAASLCQPDVLWTHNDSGDDAFIYALKTDGEHLGTWKVQNARNEDWEDMAIFKDGDGNCSIYVGEIGDNKDKHNEQRVYRVAEPRIGDADAGSSKQNPLQTAAAESIAFRYPDRPQDAETLMVHPKTGDIYVLTKRVSEPSGVYRIKPDFAEGKTVTAEKLGELAVPSIPNGLLTGGAISPDGSRVIVCDYSNAYELVLPNGASGFDEMWKQRPLVVELGDRKQGEAVSYSSDGSSVLATSERKNSPVIEVKRKN